MTTRAWVLAAGLLAGGNDMPTQEFAGSTRLRLVTVSPTASGRMISRGDTAALFAIPVSRWIALADSEPGDIVIEQFRIDVRRPLLRMSLLNPEGVLEAYFLYDGRRGTAVLIDPAERLFSEVPPGPQLDSILPVIRLGGIGSMFGVAVTPGGAMVIRGIRARSIGLKTADFWAQAWLAEADDAWWRFFATLRTLGDSAVPETAHPPEAPVLIQMLDAEGFAILDLLSIAPQRLDDSVFAVPAGYERIEFDSLIVPIPDTLTPAGPPRPDAAAHPGTAPRRSENAARRRK